MKCEHLIFLIIGFVLFLCTTKRVLCKDEKKN